MTSTNIVFGKRSRIMRTYAESNSIPEIFYFSSFDNKDSISRSLLSILSSCKSNSVNILVASHFSFNSTNKLADLVEIILLVCENGFRPNVLFLSSSDCDLFNAENKSLPFRLYSCLDWTPSCYPFEKFYSELYLMQSLSSFCNVSILRIPLVIGQEDLVWPMAFANKHLIIPSSFADKKIAVCTVTNLIKCIDNFFTNPASLLPLESPFVNNKFLLTSFISLKECKYLALIDTSSISSYMVSFLCMPTVLFFNFALLSVKIIASRPLFLRLLHMSALPFRMSYYLLKSCLLLTTTGFKYLHFRTFCFSPFTLSLLSKV